VRLARVVGTIPTYITPETQQQMKNQGPLEMGIQSMLNFPYPVVAMLNGYAFGAGCELAVCCDLRLAAEDIRMGMLAEAMRAPDSNLQEADRIVTEAFNSEGLKEAKAAFKEKRKPVFRGQ
jgi:enoyl-CoA hydratase/carnithine racemase